MASVLDFITTNPFNESFDDAMDSASDEQNKAAQRAVNEARLAEIIGQAPLDTQKKKSDMLKAQADATVAEGTVFDKIAQERNKAGYTEGQMVGQQQENSFKADLHPLDMSKAQGQANYAHQQAATEGQRTRGAAAEADVSVGTVQPRIMLANQKTANEVLAGEKTEEQIRGERIANDTAYQTGIFKVEDASNQATKSNIEIDTAEAARDTATNNKNIAAAKLEQEVFKIGASSGAGAARAFANANGVDLSPEALSSLNNKVYMAEMKGVMDQLEARMPGDANIMARDAALDQISPIILKAAQGNTPVDYAAIEAIISPVTPAIPAVKTGGGGKIWTMPDVMKEARTTAAALAKGEFGGIDQALYEKIYNETIEKYRPYIGTAGPPAGGQPAPAPIAPAPAAPALAPAAPPSAPAAAPAKVPNEQAINFLKTNATPEMRKYFDLKYGVGAAAKVLGN